MLRFLIHEKESAMRCRFICPVRQLNRRSVLLFVMAVMVCLAGCTENQPLPPKPFVVKCGDIVIDKDQFADELDIKLAAYPFDLKTSPGEYNTVVLDLVSTLADELVLLAVAQDKQVTVSEGEVTRAEAAVKADYPEDSFEQMLLENAISYEVWKQKLKRDLIVEKLVRSDLIGTQEITPEDMVEFYRQYEKQQEAGQPLDEAGLVNQLRLEKSQSSYDAWIAGLKQTHPVEIDKKAVSVFLEKIN